MGHLIHPVSCLFVKSEDSQTVTQRFLPKKYLPESNPILQDIHIIINIEQHQMSNGEANFKKI